MIDMKNLVGFCALSGDSSREVRVVFQKCLTQDIPFKRLQPNDALPDGFVPVGSVEWIISLLGKSITPDYSPVFLTKHLHRNVYLADSLNGISLPVFIKPADRYKRFDGFIYNGMQPLPEGPYVISDIVTFVNEFRLYVANGKVLTSEWYMGDDEESDYLVIPDGVFPDNYCGAVDFGILDNGNIALIEAHHPFACGWYGDDHQKYLQWLVDGWIYLKDNNS